MLTQKQRFLLTALNASGPINRLRFVKLLFLLFKDTRDSHRFPEYSFIPYRYGPFSFEMYHDIGKLEREGFLEQEGDTIRLSKNNRIAYNRQWYMPVKDHIESFNTISNRSLLNRIYSKYPFYTIFSKIERRERYLRDEIGIITIGYQERSIDVFLMELIKRKVQLVIDVRAVPFSRKYPYSKNAIKKILNEIGIQYQSIPELGVPTKIRQGPDGEKDLKRIFKWYSSYIEKHKDPVNGIIQLSEEQRIALMCYERDPNECHRHILSGIIRMHGIKVEDV